VLYCLGAGGGWDITRGIVGSTRDLVMDYVVDGLSRAVNSSCGLFQAS